jgi:Primosomal protein N'' (replication factor Y) - superfamily II helicase
LAKGHDFKKITLIIILNLDFGLFGADIHLQEQTAQLLIQVAGRAGRTGMDNKVYLQTRVADHPMFNLIKTGDYELVANEILNERKKLDLSPYIDVVYLKAEDANQARLRKFLVEAKKYLSKEHLEVYGPFEAPITKVGYKHRMFCIIQSSRKEIMLKTLDDFVSHSDKQKKEISNWVVDIDPINAS